MVSGGAASAVTWGQDRDAVVRLQPQVVGWIEQRLEIISSGAHDAEQHTPGEGMGQLLDGDACELRPFADVDLVAADVGHELGVDMGKSRVADVLHQQAADHLVARDNLHRTGIEGAQGARMAHVLELRHHQRRFLGWCLLQRRAHGHQGLHRARVGVESTARGGVGGRNQDGAGMGEIDPLQGVQAQRGAAAQDDLPVVPIGAELELDVLPEARIRALGQQGHAQAAGPALLQETLYPSLRDQDLLQDRQRAAGPTQEDEVRVEGDRGQPLLQAVHGLAQPLHENGDERPHEQDVAEDGYRRRYRGLGDALVIAQVAWIGEAQEGPPDGIRGGLEAGRERARQKTRDDRDQHDEGQDKGKARGRPANHGLFEPEQERVF